MIAIILAGGLANWFAAETVWTVVRDRPGQLRAAICAIFFTVCTWRLVFP